MTEVLLPHQVYVFGSNESGFHGAGSAGLAFRGDPSNTWRNDPFFLRAMKSYAGSSDRIGNWATYGVGRGLQRGVRGTSYAIATVTRPGARRSVTRREIYYQLVPLLSLPADTELLIAPLGTGHAGYTPAEMAEVWEFLLKQRKPDSPKFAFLKTIFPSEGSYERENVTTTTT